MHNTGFSPYRLPTVVCSLSSFMYLCMNPMSPSARSEDYGSTFVNINDRLDSSRTVVLSPTFFVSDFNPNLVNCGQNHPTVPYIPLCDPPPSLSLSLLHLSFSLQTPHNLVSTTRWMKEAASRPLPSLLQTLTRGPSSTILTKMAG